MKRNLLLLLALTGCAAPDTYLVCTVDDDISFTTTNVRHVRLEGAVMRVSRGDGDPNLIRHLLPGETCERAASIQWENEG